MTTPLGKIQNLRLSTVTASAGLLKFTSTGSSPVASNYVYVNYGRDLMGQLSPFRGACLSEIMTGATPLYIVSPFANANNTPATSATPTIINTQVMGYGTDSAGGVGFSLMSIAPVGGNSIGGVALTITGSGFSGTPTVAIGGVAATSVVKVSSVSITCVAPALPSGIYDVAVTIAGNVRTLSAAYTSFTGFTLASILPTSGTNAGGVPLTIAGSGFTAVPTAVTIGGTACTSVALVSSSSITCLSPAKAPGTYDVAVTISGVTRTLVAAYTSNDVIAALNLTLWYDGADYAAGTWTGKASAGTSVGRNATTNTSDPTVGAALNGIPTVAFNSASAQRLSINYALSTIVTASAWSMWCLCNQTSPAIAKIFGDVIDGYLEFKTDVGPVFSPDQFSGGYFGPTVASFTGQWQLLQVKYDGTNLKARVNSSAWTSVAVGNIGSLIQNCRIGAGYNLLNTFDGRIANFGASQLTLSDGTFDTIKATLNTRFGLAL